MNESDIPSWNPSISNPRGQEPFPGLPLLLSPEQLLHKTIKLSMMKEIRITQKMAQTVPSVPLAHLTSTCFEASSIAGKRPCWTTFATNTGKVDRVSKPSECWRCNSTVSDFSSFTWDAKSVDQLTCSMSLEDVKFLDPCSLNGRIRHSVEFSSSSALQTMKTDYFNRFFR